METTKVKFYMSKPNRDSDSEVYAVFVDKKYPYDNNLIECYATIGQHALAHIDYINESTEATKDQYQELYNELTGMVGYNLIVLNNSK
jgi:hypothetical protein